MASLSSLTDGEVTEFKGRLSRAGLTAEMVREVNRRDDLAARMVAAIQPKAATSDLVHGLFTTPADQLAQMREWNSQYGWGFAEEDFARVAASVPSWSEDRLTSLVLVPYLETVSRTFDALWKLAASRQETSWRGKSLRSDQKHLRLLPGIGHPGKFLCWETIDLGANRGRAPKDVRSHTTSPHAAILAAAALHPGWVRAMDVHGIPFVQLPGYQVRVPGNDQWQYVPFLALDRENWVVNLDAGWYEDAVKYCAVPVRRE